MLRNNFLKRKSILSNATYQEGRGCSMMNTSTQIRLSRLWMTQTSLASWMCLCNWEKFATILIFLKPGLLNHLSLCKIELDTTTALWYTKLSKTILWNQWTCKVSISFSQSLNRSQRLSMKAIKSYTQKDLWFKLLEKIKIISIQWPTIYYNQDHQLMDLLSEEDYL